MQSEREFLEESRDFWLEDARMGAMQSRLSRVIMWSGRLTTLGGVALIVEGKPLAGGLIALGGGATSHIFNRLSQDESNDAFEAEVIALERQDQIDRIDDN